MSKKDPKLDILYRSLEYGKKKLNSEHLSEKNKMIIEGMNEEIEALIKHVKHIESENEMLKRRVDELEEMIDG